jgi:hypothetical protein
VALFSVALFSVALFSVALFSVALFSVALSYKSDPLPYKNDPQFWSNISKLCNVFVQRANLLIVLLFFVRLPGTTQY